MSGFSCELFIKFDISYSIIILTKIKLDIEYLFKCDIDLLKDWILDLDQECVGVELTWS